MPQARPSISSERTRFSPERILFIAAGVILVLGSQLPVASYLSPKYGLGYALGIIGGLMLFAQSLYAVRKLVPSLGFLGSVRTWFQWHILLGTTAPVLILMHCGFRLGATNSNIALFAMLLVAASGLLGRFLDSKLRQIKATRGNSVVYQRLCTVWHIVHVPLFLILIVATVLHVVAVHLY
jgi:hypothetical protein